VNRLALPLTLAGVLATVAACTGTETGNPSLRSQMGFQGKTSMPLVVGLPGEGAPAVVTDLHAHVASVDFHAAGECPAPSGPVELRDVGAIDLLAPEGNIRELDVAEDAYCAVAFALTVAPSGAVPPDLAGRSIALRGRRRSDGATFVWSSDADQTIVMPVMDALFIIDPEHLDHVITLDVATLLGRSDLEAAVTGADGLIHLDAPENATIDAMILESLAPGAALHRDPDGNGHHDPGEPEVVHGLH
jgi:hypothetical protein